MDGSTGCNNEVYNRLDADESMINGFKPKKAKVSLNILATCDLFRKRLTFERIKKVFEK